VKSKLQPPETKPLKLKCDKLLSTCAFEFNLRRYNPARQSRLLTSLLPVTAPLFFISVERFLPAVITPAGAAYGAVCGGIGAAALWCAW